MRIIFSLILLVVCSYQTSLWAQGTSNYDYTNDLAFAIHFESDQIQPEKALLEDLTSKAQQWSYKKIVLQGHTDDIGTAAYNQALSQQRVQNIRQILVKAGIASKRIVTKAWGENKPIASNHNIEGQQLNRRVDVLLTNREDWETDRQVKLQQKFQKLIDDSGQFFTLKNTHQAQSIIGIHGTQVHIPANAFDCPADKKVKLQIVEVFDKSDMILYNLSTSSNGKQLVTGGMVKIEATADGKAVALRDGKSLTVEVPTNQATPEMQLFDSEQVGNNINWVNPQPLQQVALTAANVTGVKAFSVQEPLFPRPNGYYRIQTRPILPPKETISRGDSIHILQLKNQLANADATLWDNFDPYKKKRFLFWWIRKKKNHKDSLAHIEQNELKKERLRNSIATERKRLAKLKQDLNKYFDYEAAQKLYDNWPAYKDSLMALNLGIAFKQKDLKGIKKYSLSVPIDQQYEHWMELLNIKTKSKMQSFFQQSIAYRDSVFGDFACNQKDTAWLVFMEKQSHQAKTLMCIYDTKTPEEAVAKHQEVGELRYYTYMAQQLGVNSPEEAKKLIRLRNKTASYQFQLKKLGRFINCDYFPNQLPNQQLATCRTELAVPLNNTMTYMVFDKMNTVMKGYYSNYGSWRFETPTANSCNFPNIPLKTPVKIVSIYLDEDDNTRVAIVATKSTEKLPKLSYKTMTDTELKAALEKLNT